MHTAAAPSPKVICSSCRRVQQYVSFRHSTFSLGYLVMHCLWTGRPGTRLERRVRVSCTCAQDLELCLNHRHSIKEASAISSHVAIPCSIRYTAKPSLTTPTQYQQARNQMLTSNQSHRLPRSSKASLQACKCKQAAPSLTTQATSEKAHPASQPTCYQTSHTRSSIEKDSPLIPGEIDRLDPAQLSRLSTTTRLPPVPPLMITHAQRHRHRHRHRRLTTRRSPNIQVSTARLAWAWGHMRFSWRGTYHRPRVLGNPIPRGHVPGSFVGWESLALLHGRFDRARLSRLTN